MNVALRLLLLWFLLSVLVSLWFARVMKDGLS